MTTKTLTQQVKKSSKHKPANSAGEPIESATPAAEPKPYPGENANQPVTITLRQLSKLIGADTMRYTPVQMLAGALDQAARIFEIVGDSVGDGTEGVLSELQTLIDCETGRMRATADICAKLAGEMCPGTEDYQ